MEWLNIAGLLLVVASVAAGVTGAVLRTWSLHSRLYSLEDRTAVLEGVTQREVKIRAGQARQARPDRDAALLEALKPTGVTPARKANWWETGLPRSAPQ